MLKVDVRDGDNQSMQDPTETGDTARPGRRPDFLLVGAMKCGTSTLHDHLEMHPGIFMASPKEPQFFSRDEIFGRGLAWYEALFSDAGDRLCGESSTCYSRWPFHGDVVGRIAEALPDARFIYQMRNPIDRAYSHYRHAMQERIAASAQELPDFETMLAEDPEVLGASRYLEQIEQFLARFPRERFHFLLLEDLQTGPTAALASLQQFLELPVHDLALPGEAASNQFGDKLAKRDMHRWLGQLRRAPGVGWATSLASAEQRARVRAALTNPRFARRLMGWRTPAHRERIGAFHPATRQRLVEEFRAPNAALAAFLGRDLEHWNR